MKRDLDGLIQRVGDRDGRPSYVVLGPDTRRDSQYGNDRERCSHSENAIHLLALLRILIFNSVGRRCWHYSELMDAETLGHCCRRVAKWQASRIQNRRESAIGAVCARPLILNELHHEKGYGQN